MKQDRAISSRQQLWALPGFLGLKKDWEVFNFSSVRLFDFDDFTFSSLHTLADSLNQLALQQKTFPTLMGYSLGARVALHALIQAPQLWKSAILISANPGLTEVQAKKRRLQSDKQWANRFLIESWEKVTEDWNDQPIFLKTKQLKRVEENYSREKIFHLLTSTSLGVQQDLRAKIKALPMPILWVVGKEDTKYLEFSKSIRFSHPLSKVAVLTKAGHRAPWDQPFKFKKVVHEFLLL